MDLAVPIRQQRSSRYGLEALWANLTRIIRSLAYSKSIAAGILLTASFVITFARLLAPFEVGTDQAIQLEAAQRLVSGLGLTTTNDANHYSQDLADLPTPARLVQWPPGFSLVLAGCLLMGISLLTSLKVIYGFTTVVGWLGWTIIASRVVSRPLRPRWKRLRIHYLFAALLPIFYTPLWKGTDLFLWAGIPFFVLLLWKASAVRHAWKLLLTAGLLFASLCSLRYASGFLLIAAVLILFQVSYPSITSFMKRLVVFLLPSLVVSLLLIAPLKTAPQQNAGLPTAGAVGQGMSALTQKIQAILNGSPVTSTLIFGTPILSRITSEVNSRPFNYAVGLTCILFIGILPILVQRNWDKEATPSQKNLALSLSFLPLSLVTFLIVARLVGNSSLFGIKRYYEPLALCALLLFYNFATAGVHRVARACSQSVVMLFLAYTILFNSALLMVSGRRGQLVQSVLAFTPSKSTLQHSTSQDLPFPAWKSYSWKESSREAVKELYRTSPDALFIAQEYPLFIYDRFAGKGPVPGSQMIDYPGADYLGHAYTSRPLKVFWVVASTTKMDFVEATNLKLVHSDPIEDTSIYESNLPAGYRFVSH